MKKGRRFLVFVVLLMTFVWSCAVSHPELQKLETLHLQSGDGKKYFGDASLEERGGVLFLHVTGSPFSMGYQQGVLLRKEINDKVKRISPYFQWSSGHWQWVRNCLRNIPDEYLEEWKGIASGAKVPHDLLVASEFFQLSGISHGCSNFVVYGKATSDGNLMHGRTFDWKTDELFKNQVVIFRHPARGFPFLGITLPGCINAYSGVNSNMVSCADDAARDITSPPVECKPYGDILVRKILQEAKDLESASKIVDKFRPLPVILLVSDGRNNRAVVFEIGNGFISQREPLDNFIVCTNHFVKNPLASNIHIDGSRMRYDYYKNKIRSDFGTIDKMKSLLYLKNYREDKAISDFTNKHFKGYDVQHAFVFLPATQKLFISINLVTGPDKFLEIDLKKEFAKKGSSH